MKWLSVKKYKPLVGIHSFVLTSDGSRYVAYFHPAFNKWHSTWSSEKDLDVTHFCIPDPLEIEEE